MEASKAFAPLPSRGIADVAFPLAGNAAGVAAVALCALCALAIHLPLPPNHDVAWILEGARSLLNGARFGSDIVDVNPPLIWWISTVPAWVSRACGLPLAQTNTSFVVLLALMAITLCDRALAASNNSRRQRAVLAAASAAILLLVPGYDFGQREHLMAIGAVAYLTLAAMRAERARMPVWLCIAIGLFAAPLLCLKPYFLLVPITTELWLAWRSRSLTSWFRSENIILGVFSVLYVLAVYLFTPLYFSAVVKEAVVVYWTYDNPLPLVMENAVLSLLPALVCVLLLYLFRRDTPTPTAQAYLAGACGAALAAIVQLKGWRYHLFPAIGFSAIGCVAFALGISSRKKLDLLRCTGLIVFAVYLSSPAIEQVNDSVAHRGTADWVERLAKAFSTYGGQQPSIYAFTTSPRDVHPAVLAASAVWAARASCLYTIPAGVRADERPPAERAAARLASRKGTDLVLSDIEQRKPRIVVVSTGRYMLGFAGKPFDYLSYFEAYPRFRAQWRHYSERPRIGNFRIFVRDR